MDPMADATQPLSGFSSRGDDGLYERPRRSNRKFSSRGPAYCNATMNKIEKFVEMLFISNPHSGSK